MAKNDDLNDDQKIIDVGDDIPDPTQSNDPDAIKWEEEDQVPPAIEDEELNNDPEMDDDVDKLGKKMGIHYDPDEELTFKIPVKTPIDPPEKLEE